MDKSTTESNTIVADILEDLLDELPIENQENEDLDEDIESQPSDDSDEVIQSQPSIDSDEDSDEGSVEAPFVMVLVYDELNDQWVAVRFDLGFL